MDEMSLGLPEPRYDAHSPTKFFGGSGSVNLNAVVAADYNGNGVVDAADYNRVAPKHSEATTDLAGQRRQHGRERQE